MSSFKIPNYTQAPNIFIDEFMSKCTGGEVKVFLSITRKTIGWHKTTDRISYSQLREITGLSTNAIKEALKKLIEKNLITQTETNVGFIYDLNITVSESDTDVSESDTAAVSENDTTKESLKDTINKIKYIVEYLNNKTSKNFKHDTAATQRYIKARFKEGFTVDDFKKIIDIKCDEWLNDKAMEKYLRPETLFSNKFEGYLNQKYKKEEVSKPKKCPSCFLPLDGGRCINQLCKEYKQSV